MVSRFEQFTIGISAVYRYIQKIERNEMERYGLRGAYAQYLLAIDRFPEGVTAVELCELCEKDKAAVSRAVSEMTSQGLVRRVLKNERAYKARLHLTEEGQKAAEYVRKRARAAVEQAGSGLTDEDRKVFYATLERIATNLQTICRDGILDDNENQEQV